MTKVRIDKDEFYPYPRIARKKASYYGVEVDVPPAVVKHWERVLAEFNEVVSEIWEYVESAGGSWSAVDEDGDMWAMNEKGTWEPVFVAGMHYPPTKHKPRSAGLRGIRASMILDTATDRKVRTSDGYE